MSSYILVVIDLQHVDKDKKRWKMHIQSPENNIVFYSFFLSKLCNANCQRFILFPTFHTDVTLFVFQDECDCIQNILKPQKIMQYNW